MDILDPIEGSNNEEHKNIMHQTLSIVEEHSMDDEDDDPLVEHLSPQTLLETPQDGDVQYSFRTPEGTVTYGVLKVEDHDNVPQILSSSSFTNSGVQQVLTSNLNGQLYVIGNPNEVYVSSQSATGRAIAPRSSIIENTQVVTTNLKKRDERRRATHNEVERRRRDKINNWITKLSKIIPEGTSPEMKGNGHYDGQSKGGILAKACDYIVELRDAQSKLELCMKENKKLAECVDNIKHKQMTVERENRALREILKRHGIEVNNLNTTS